MAKVLFRNVTVLDCTGTPPFTGQVLVEGNRIKAVSPQGTPLASDGAHVVDGGAATLMPGLVEAHSHLTFLDTADLESLGLRAARRSTHCARPRTPENSLSRVLPRATARRRPRRAWMS